MLSKFLKLFEANHSVATKSLADKVAELQARPSKSTQKNRDAGPRSVL